MHDQEAREILGDVERLNVHEAACRTAVGELAEVLCRRKAHQRLGFVRLSDYARERLGLSAHEVESLAQVTTKFRCLPAIAAVFARGVNVLADNTDAGHAAGMSR